MSSTIYIIYNADSSVLSKLKYAHTKLMQSSSDESLCSACDLTHNGLHLTETSQWSATKKRIHGADIKQLHRDELSAEVSVDYCTDENPSILPSIVRQTNEGRRGD